MSASEEGFWFCEAVCDTAGPSCVCASELSPGPVPQRVGSLARGRWVRDDEGFTAFCDREYPIVVGALSVWCGDRGVAEEVTSEAFARAYRDWGRVAHLDAPGAWVRRVAINLATSTLRRRRAERRARRRLAARAETERYEHDSVERVAVRQALQRLRPDQRNVLVLRYLLDLPIDEVAQAMGRSPTSVTTLTQRACAALREMLGDEDEMVQEGRHD